MKNKIAIVLNLLIGILTFGSWLYMVFFSPAAADLSSNGLGNLKFFTVLSNLFNGGVCLFYAFWLIFGKEITVFKKTLKLTATVAVGLTFITVMLFLAPLYGYPRMLQGSNLWMHLSLPVASFISLLCFETGTRIPFTKTFWSILPPAVYSVGYVLNIIINGMGVEQNGNDFYGFLNWGYAVGAVIAVVILLTSWLISVLFYFTGKMRIKK